MSLSFTPSIKKPALERAQFKLTPSLGSPKSVDAAGTGAQTSGSATALPSSIDFGAIRVHGTTPPQIITVTNTSNTASLQVTSAAITAGADQFGIASDTCTGRLVAPGNTCSVAVTFSPTYVNQAPAVSNGTLELADNAGTQDVSLFGTGNGGVSDWSRTTGTYGFPDCYEDETGLKLKPCLDTNDLTCVLLADPNFIPANGVSQTNFPGESFYMVADSDKITTPGCEASVVDGVFYPKVDPGRAKYRAAIEAAFANGPVVWGDQITFARTKIVADGLCPMTAYYFTHPYGRDLITTNNLGQVVANKKGGTIDIGCGGTPCVFSDALNSRVFGGFLKWDPSVDPQAPAWHLGDGNLGTLHTITGSPFIDPVNKGAANFFRIQSDAQSTQIPGAFTNLFTVAGAIAQ